MLFVWKSQFHIHYSSITPTPMLFPSLYLNEIKYPIHFQTKTNQCYKINGITFRIKNQ